MLLHTALKYQVKVQQAAAAAFGEREREETDRRTERVERGERRDRQSLARTYLHTQTSTYAHMESVAEEEKASSPAAAAAGRSTTTTGAVEGSLLSCLPSLAEETVIEDDGDDGDGDAAVAEEQSPAMLPTSSLSLAAGSAAVAPGRRRLPIVPAQIASVSQDPRDKASVFSNIPPRPSRE
jgi:hypothetical protein